MRSVCLCASACPVCVLCVSRLPSCIFTGNETTSIPVNCFLPYTLGEDRVGMEAVVNATSPPSLPPAPLRPLMELLASLTTFLSTFHTTLLAAIASTSTTTKSAPTFSAANPATDKHALECALDPVRSWHSVRLIWYCILFVVGMLIVLLSNAVRHDRRQVRDMLALLTPEQSWILRRRLRAAAPASAKAAPASNRRLRVATPVSAKAAPASNTAVVGGAIDKVPALTKASGSGMTKLIKLSDASGELKTTEVAAERLERSMLVTDDVFIVDTGSEIFVWVGKGATPKEKRGGLANGVAYAEQSERPKGTRVLKVMEGSEPTTFKTNFKDWDTWAPQSDSMKPLESKKVKEPFAAAASSNSSSTTSTSTSIISTSSGGGGGGNFGGTSMVVVADLQDAPDPGAVFDAILSSTSATDTRTISEIGDYLISQCTMKLALVPRVLRMIDANGDGIIDRCEFIKAHEAGIFVSKVPAARTAAARAGRAPPASAIPIKLASASTSPPPSPPVASDMEEETTTATETVLDRTEETTTSTSMSVAKPDNTPDKASAIVAKSLLPALDRVVTDELMASYPKEIEKLKTENTKLDRDIDELMESDDLERVTTLMSERRRNRNRISDLEGELQHALKAAPLPPTADFAIPALARVLVISPKIAPNPRPETRVDLQEQLISQRRHKDDDSVWKRLCIACIHNHSLTASIFTQGAPGFTRAQTVMILANVFAFELVMLCLLYSAPEPLPVDHVTGLPLVEAVPAVVINPLAIFFSACVAAAMCIPASVIFAGVFDPIIFLRVPKNLMSPYRFVWMRLKGWLCPQRPKVTVSDAREAADEQQVSSTIVESFVPDAPDDGAQLEVKGDPKPDSDSSETDFNIPEINGIMANLGSLLASPHLASALINAEEFVEEWDADGDGAIDKIEFRAAAAALGYDAPHKDVDEVFATLDSNGGGKIEIDELDGALASAVSEAAGIELEQPRAAPAAARAQKRKVEQTVDRLRTPRGPGARLQNSLRKAARAEAAVAALRRTRISLAASPPPSPSPLHARGSTVHMSDSPSAPGETHFSAGDLSPSAVQLSDSPFAPGETRFSARESSPRAISNESNNEGLLKTSLTYSWGNKDWAAVKKILLSWTLSLSLFVIACFFFLLYGCQLFEPQQQQQQESDDGAGNPYELIYAWAISCFLRFLLVEPALILASKGLPMLGCLPGWAE